MPQSRKIDPKSIVIRRDQRQRREADDELMESVAKHGLWHPIVVRVEGDETVLIAGERRLNAVLRLEHTEVDVTDFGDLTQNQAKIIELEENIRRRDISWREQVKATAEIHDLYAKDDPNWTPAMTAAKIPLQQQQMQRIMTVAKRLDDPIIANASGIFNAYEILMRFADRQAESAVSKIIAAGAGIFSDEARGQVDEGGGEGGEGPGAPTNVSQPVASDTGAGGGEPPTLQAPGGPSAGPVSTPTPTPYVPPTDPIVNADFVQWIEAYNGPKFNLIHCDFPYGTYKGDDSTGTYIVNTFYDNEPDVYWRLTKCLCANLDKIMSHSAHMIFWFDMKFYEQTRLMFAQLGLNVHPHPWVWHKTNGGVQPGTPATHPRRTIDTALLCFRGSRPLAKPGPGSYGAPMTNNKFHPSQKPEPMLRVLLSMFVDETTTMFDPTAGSGSALRAAEDLGAKYTLGLELNAEFAQSANSHVKSARTLRAMGR